MIAISPALQHNWDWRAAGNFVCGGTGTGLLAMTAASAWLGGSHVDITAIAALAIIALGLFLVWLEIGRPWRFANVFRNPATSWMSREAWAAVALFPVAALGAVLNSPSLLSVAALLGLAFLFCQAQMLRAAKGIPAWRDAAVVPLVAATGLTEGGGLLVIILAAIASVPQWLSSAVLILIAVRTVLMVVYAFRLNRERLPTAALGRLGTITALVVVAGGALPVLLLTVPAPSWAVALGGLLAAASGWHLKYELVCTLALTQGFSIERTPSRGAASAQTGIRPGWAPRLHDNESNGS